MDKPRPSKEFIAWYLSFLLANLNEGEVSQPAAEDHHEDVNAQRRRAIVQPKSSHAAQYVPSKARRGSARKPS